MMVQGNKNQKRCFNKNTLDRIVVEERQEETIAKVSDWAKKEIDWYNSALLTLGPQQPPLDHHQGEIDPWDWLYICKLIRICNRGNWNGGEGGKRDGIDISIYICWVQVICGDWNMSWGQSHKSTIFSIYILTSRKWIHRRIVCRDGHWLRWAEAFIRRGMKERKKLQLEEWVVDGARDCYDGYQNGTSF